MRAKAKILSNKDIGLMKIHFGSVFFPNSFNLVYEDQVPNVGIILLEGKVLITKKKKVLGTIAVGAVLGVEELIHNELASYGYKLQGNSRVILLQKSEIFEILKGQDSDLKQAIYSLW